MPLSFGGSLVMYLTIHVRLEVALVVVLWSRNQEKKTTTNQQLEHLSC